MKTKLLLLCLLFSSCATIKHDMKNSTPKDWVKTIKKQNAEKKCPAFKKL